MWISNRLSTIYWRVYLFSTILQCLFVINVGGYMSVCFWTPCCIPLACYLSLSQYHIVIVAVLQVSISDILISWFLSSNVVLQYWLGYSWSFAFSYKFQNQLVKSHTCTKTCLGFWWELCASNIDQYGDSWLVSTVLSLPIHGWYICPFI